MSDIIEGLERVVESFESNPGIVSASKIAQQAEKCAEQTPDVESQILIIVAIIIITFVTVLILIIICINVRNRLSSIIIGIIIVLYVLSIYIIATRSKSFTLNLESCAEQVENAADIAVTEAEIRVSRALCAYSNTCP